MFALWVYDGWAMLAAEDAYDDVEEDAPEDADEEHGDDGDVEFDVFAFVTNVAGEVA